MAASKASAVVDQLLADLRRQADGAFVELVLAQDDPELKRMLADLARDTRRAHQALLEGR